MNRLQFRIQNLQNLRTESNVSSTEQLPEFKHNYSLGSLGQMSLEGRMAQDELIQLKFSLENVASSEVGALIDVWVEFALKRKNFTAIKNIKPTEIENYLRDNIGGTFSMDERFYPLF